MKHCRSSRIRRLAYRVSGVICLLRQKSAPARPSRGKNRREGADGWRIDQDPIPTQRALNALTPYDSGIDGSNII